MSGIPVFKTVPPKINHNSPSLLFVGLDGCTYISDRYGTRPASGAALALLLHPARRATVFRAEVDNG